MPLAALGPLAASEAIRFVHEPLRSLPYEVTSEGVGLSGGPLWHGAGLTGAGVKVAILDGGFEGYDSLLGDELPANVVTRSFRADERMDDGEHGTACAEIIHDMAPAAELYLVASDNEDENLEAISWLIEQGVDVISASFGNPLWGPGDGTGPIHDKINEATDRGILWVNSAGNFGENHWAGDWSDQDGNGFLEFASGDEGNTFTLTRGETAMVYLRWNDPWDASCNDYDLAVYDSLGSEAGLLSNNYQDCDTAEPWEAAELMTAVLDEDFTVKIKRFDADGQAEFDLFVYCQDCSALSHVTPEGSISAPADAASALTVGAVDVLTPTDDRGLQLARPDRGRPGQARSGRPRPGVDGHVQSWVVWGNVGGHPSCGRSGGAGQAGQSELLAPADQGLPRGPRCRPGQCRQGQRLRFRPALARRRAASRPVSHPDSDALAFRRAASELPPRRQVGDVGVGRPGQRPGGTGAGDLL